MLFPDVTLEAWRSKYPELKVLTYKCEQCGSVSKADRPFIIKGYAGLTARPCACAKSNHTCSSLVTTNETEHNKWRRALATYT